MVTPRWSNRFKFLDGLILVSQVSWEIHGLYACQYRPLEPISIIRSNDVTQTQFDSIGIEVFKKFEQLETRRFECSSPWYLKAFEYIWFVGCDDCKFLRQRIPRHLERVRSWLYSVSSWCSFFCLYLMKLGENGLVRLRRIYLHRIFHPWRSQLRKVYIR